MTTFKPPPYTMDQLNTLREKTGHSLMTCRKAMHHCDGDILKAEAWLATGAWKFGMLINYRRS